jgi:hypothetical protein
VRAVAGERRGHLDGRERVVAAGFDLRRQAGEDTLTIVVNTARLAVEQRSRLADRADERLDDRMMAEADAERGHGRTERTDELHRDTAVRRPTGPWGDDKALA